MSENAGSPKLTERSMAAVTGGNVANLVKRISTELQSKSEAPARPGAADVKQWRVKASFSYTPQNEDELRLEVDDVIEILGEEEEGWWKGRLKGRVGVFPANFVKPLEGCSLAEGRHENEEKAKVEEPAEGHSSGAVEIQPKKVTGIGFGNIFATNQKIELRNVKPVAPAGIGGSEVKKSTEGGAGFGTGSDGTSQKTPIANGKKPLPNPSSSLADSGTGQKQKDYAKALFAYDAENEDELSLQEGDIIVVISKDVEDAGWWMGEINGKRGVFPDNFVTAISAEEAEKAKKPSASSAASSIVPPTVPAKPPKSVASATHPEPVKLPPFMLNDSKQETSLGTPKQPTLPKHMGDNHAKGETHSGEKGPSDKEKSSQSQKPLVPLVGMPRSKQFNSGRLLGGSGANSPNPDEKMIDGDGECDGVSGVDADKLSHPTAARARNPNRRPPSQAFLKDMVIEPGLVGSVIGASVDDSPVLPKNISGSSSSFEMVNSNGKFRSDHGGEEYVRREEFEKLQAAFESFKRETKERMKEMEKLLAGKSPKL